MPSKKLLGARYAAFVHPCPHGEQATEVRLVKGWWGGPGVGGRERTVHQFCIQTGDALEPERVARALEAAAAALRG